MFLSFFLSLTRMCTQDDTRTKHKHIDTDTDRGTDTVTDTDTDTHFLSHTVQA
jgi:hypothetical protein